HRNRLVPVVGRLVRDVGDGEERRLTVLLAQPRQRVGRLIGQLGADLREHLRLRGDALRREVDHPDEGPGLEAGVERHRTRPLLQRLAVVALEVRVGKRQRPAARDEQRESAQEPPHGKSLRRKRVRSGTPAASTAARPPSSRSTSATTPSTRKPSLRTRSTAFSVLAPVVTTSSTTATAAPAGIDFFPSSHCAVPCPFGSLRT